MTAEPDGREGKDFAALDERLRAFAISRDWYRHHNPKNLGMSMAIEVGELLECFQWLSDDQAIEVKRHPAEMAHVRSEIADVFIYLMYLAHSLEVNLLAAAWEKMDVNEHRFVPKALEQQPG